MFGGGLVAREQQEVADGGRHLVRQFVAVLADQRAEQIVTRIGPMAAHQPGHVREGPGHRRMAFLDTGGEVRQHPGAVLEVGTVGVRHAD
jgi:hypothetical protein